MKILNTLIKEEYIKDTLKSYNNDVVKFKDKHSSKIGKDITEIFEEINKFLKSSFDNISQKDVKFKKIFGNSNKKELTFILEVNGKEKECITDYKEITDIIKKLKSTTGIDMNKLNEKIEKNKSRLVVFLDLEEIIENVIKFVNTFNKIEVSIIE